MRQARNLSAKF